MEWIERFRDGIADRYALGLEIGAGGMGAVYRADDLKHGRAVAIKVLRPDLTRSVAGSRFLREIEISAQLSHPNIVPVFDSGHVGDTLYYVMPLVEGESLRSLLDREGPLSAERAADIARGVADGLGHAHERGIVHRDIKPSNILISGQHALIVDFGVARALEVATDTLTKSGDMIGTPVYMSPEQLLDGEVDGRSDMYALGCVLLEMLSGRPPLAGKTPSAIMASHIRGIVDPAELAVDLPDQIGAVVRCSLARDPRDRYQSAGEFMDALAGAGSRGPASGVAMRLRGRWQHRIRRFALAAVIGGLAMWGIWSATAGLSRDAADGDVYAVLAYPLPGATPAEVTFLVDAASELTRQLNRFQSVRAVPPVSMTGAMMDLGITGPTLERPGDGIRIARESGAGRLVMLSGRFMQDDVSLSAAVQSVSTRWGADFSVDSDGPRADLELTVAPITYAILDIDEATPTRGLWTQSSNLDALRAYRRGVRSLGLARLDEAEAEFRLAVGLDSTFAMALHDLALTLYWRAPAGRAPSDDVPRFALAAVRESAGLPVRDSLRAEALYRFIDGDYARARQLYERLIDIEPADVYARLLLGIVEYNDPWLAIDGSGGSSPRANWNRARDEFAAAMDLAPGFHLGYGHVFDIGSDVFETAQQRQGIPFHRPRPQFVAPWAEVPRDPGESMDAFYPVYLDSIVWLDRPAFDALDPERVEEGASQMLDESMDLLGRWVRYDPTAPRPREELADWLASQRRTLSGSTSREEAERLASIALAEADTALGLRSDTSMSSLTRIARLQLGAGRVDAAAATLEEALRVRMDVGSTEPLSAGEANIPLARGRVDESLDLVALLPVGYIGVEDPVTGVVTTDGGASLLLNELRVLGATAADRALVDDALARLSAMWSDEEYTEYQLERFRSSALPRVALALARSPDYRDEWSDVLTSPIWALLDGSREPVESAILSADAPDGFVPEAERAFLLGGIAASAGLDELAIRLWTRLDTLVHDVQGLDAGWGLEPLSHLLRSLAHERLGNAAEARMHRQTFLQMWPEPHSPAISPILEGIDGIVAF